MKPILEIQNISKKFTLNHQGVPYYSLRDKLTNLFSTNIKEDFWALRDISFDVQQGESLGIIGRNGAGKSTLLKILSRITPPTNGRVLARGRIASLLEVGTGFHQELTGRENIFMNGSILGMKRSEIKRKFDEIVDFSGTEKFLDTQLKHYSSGMQLRLAFAVAANLDPEILIIDEVLAVGDAEFQKKCLKKMQDVTSLGRTVLFVSHNLQAVSTLTTKSIWINKGEIQAVGKTNDVISAYHREVFSNDLIHLNTTGSQNPHIKEIEIFTSHPNNIHKQGSPFKVRVTLSSQESLKNACLSFQIRDDLDRNFLHVWLFDAQPELCSKPGECIVECNIPNLRLYMGKYHLKFYFTGPPGGKVYEELDYVCPFEVVMYDMPRLFEWQPGTTAYIDEWTWKIDQH
jgi:lipopolysaccharide transport system ATP-binding protein